MKIGLEITIDLMRLLENKECDDVYKECRKIRYKVYQSLKKHYSEHPKAEGSIIVMRGDDVCILLIYTRLFDIEMNKNIIEKALSEIIKIEPLDIFHVIQLNIVCF